MEQEIVENFVFKGFCFPVLLPIAVFKVNSRGTKLLDINIDDLKDRVAFGLMTYPYAYDGAKINFIRNYMEMTHEALGAVIGVSGNVIFEWEEAKHITVGLSLEQRHIIIDKLKEFYFNKKEYVIEDSKLRHKETWNEENRDLLEVGMLYYLK